MESAKNEGGSFSDSKFRQEIYSKVIRAGKRTYFFDVKSTRGDEYYLTITESKKRFNDNGKYNYEKHKIFLYKEDFEKFIGSLQEVFDYIYDHLVLVRDYVDNQPSSMGCARLDLDVGKQLRR